MTGADGGEPLEPPAVPFAIYGSPGNAEVPLRWLPSLAAAVYRVKRANSVSGPFVTIATVSGTSYIDKGLSNGTTYYYVVTATNPQGESGNSPVETVAPATP